MDQYLVEDIYLGCWTESGLSDKELWLDTNGNLYWKVPSQNHRFYFYTNEARSVERWLKYFVWDKRWINT